MLRYLLILKKSKAIIHLRLIRDKKLKMNLMIVLRMIRMMMSSRTVPHSMITKW